MCSYWSKGMEWSRAAYDTITFTVQLLSRVNEYFRSETFEKRPFTPSPDSNFAYLSMIILCNFTFSTQNYNIKPEKSLCGGQMPLLIRVAYCSNSLTLSVTVSVCRFFETVTAALTLLFFVDRSYIGNEVEYEVASCETKMRTHIK